MAVRTSGQASQCLNRFLSPNKVSEYCLSCDFIATFSFTGDRCCVQRRAGVVSWYLAGCTIPAVNIPSYVVLMPQSSEESVLCLVRPQQRRFCRGRTHRCRLEQHLHVSREVTRSRELAITGHALNIIPPMFLFH